jgi:GT2 family glycosyltransferase
MRLSIIVATYNRATLLDECLAHLARQRFEPGDEVLVVDNASTDGTPAVIARHRASFPTTLHYLHEPHAGKSHALERALAIATGEILAFTDDDVDVAGHWLDAIRAAMADPGIALVGGPVIPRWERPQPRWLRFPNGGFGRLGAPLALLDYGRERVPLGPRTLLGANMAIRRTAIDRVGGFPRSLGKLRGTLLSGEDHDVCRRVSAAGLGALYCPDAVVAHWVPAARLRVAYFLSWFYWSGITHAVLDETGERHSRAICGVPLYLLKQSAAAACGTIVSLATARPSAALESAVDVAFAAGYVAKRWGLTRAGSSAPSGAVGAPAV